MAWNDDTYLIGEKIRDKNYPDLGVVSRIDLERGIIYVLYKRGKEVAYLFPDDINNGILIPDSEVLKKKKKVDEEQPK
jgi:hypothetical protein